MPKNQNEIKHTHYSGALCGFIFVGGMNTKSTSKHNKVTIRCSLVRRMGLEAGKEETELQSFGLRFQ